MPKFVHVDYWFMSGSLEDSIAKLKQAGVSLHKINRYFNSAMITNFVIISDKEIHFDVSELSDYHFISNDIGFFRSLIEEE